MKNVNLTIGSARSVNLNHQLPKNSVGMRIIDAVFAWVSCGPLDGGGDESMTTLKAICPMVQIPVEVTWIIQLNEVSLSTGISYNTAGSTTYSGEYQPWRAKTGPVCDTCCELQRVEDLQAELAATQRSRIHLARQYLRHQKERINWRWNRHNENMSTNCQVTFWIGQIGLIDVENINPVDGGHQRQHLFRVVICTFN